jgi:hypothetical protein
MNQWRGSLCVVLLSLAAPAVLAQSSPPSTTPPSTTNTPATNPQNPTTPPELRNPQNPTDPDNPNAKRMGTPPPASNGWPSFEQADADRDSSISSTEYDSALLSMGSATKVPMQELDTNGDGKISKEEWNHYRSGRPDAQRK